MREQMNALDDFEMRDLWDEVQRRTPRADGPEPPRRRSLARPVMLLVASILVIGLVLYGLRALGSAKPTALSSGVPETLTLWPEHTSPEIAATQAKVDAGDQSLAWRLDPKDVSTRFAEDVLGWDPPTTASGGIRYTVTLDPAWSEADPTATVKLSWVPLPCPPQPPSGVATCPPPYQSEQLNLQRSGGGKGTGIWTVSAVRASGFDLALEDGEQLGNGDPMTGSVEFPSVAKTSADYVAQYGFMVGGGGDCEGGSVNGIDPIKDGSISISAQVGREGWSNEGCPSTVPGFAFVASASVEPCPPNTIGCYFVALVGTSDLTETHQPLYGLTAVPISVDVLGSAGSASGSSAPTSTPVKASATTSSTSEGDQAAAVRIPVPAPQPIVAGEGAIWVVSGTSENDNQLWRIDPSTDRAAPIQGTTGAIWPAAGEGWGWVTTSNNQLLKIDPTSGAVVSTISLPGYPFVVNAGLGSAWVSTDKGLVRVDPQTDVATTLPVKTDLLGSSQGYLWTTGTAGSGFSGIAKIDPADGSVMAAVPFKDPCVILPTETAVWVASCQGGLPPGTGPDHLARIDPRSGHVDYDVDLSTPGQLAYSDGSLWLSHWEETGRTVSVDQLDPGSGEPTGVRTIVAPGDQAWIGAGIGPPAVFTAILDGSFWLTHVDADDVVRTSVP